MSIRQRIRRRVQQSRSDMRAVVQPWFGRRPASFRQMDPSEPVVARSSSSATQARPATPVAASKVEESLTIHAGEATHSVTVAPGQTLLEAGLKAGVKMPYSCALGGCGACKVKAAGEVAMATPNCLTPDERDAGYVLACVCHAAGPVTVVLP